MGPKDYDRITQNEDDKQVFYGYDDEEEKKTYWYTKDDILDSVTPTPFDDEDEW